MNREIELKFLALLVHRGMLDAGSAREAIETSSPSDFLIKKGVLSEAEWREWLATEAGTWPKLARYELSELLGEGGEARVFRARDRKAGVACALKVLRPELCKETTVVKRFIAESKLLQELDSPHIVRGLRVAKEGDSIYCAMEVIEGLG